MFSFFVFCFFLVLFVDDFFFFVIFFRRLQRHLRSLVGLSSFYIHQRGTLTLQASRQTTRQAEAHIQSCAKHARVRVNTHTHTHTHTHTQVLTLFHTHIHEHTYNTRTQTYSQASASPSKLYRAIFSQIQTRVERITWVFTVFLYPNITTYIYIYIYI